MQGGGPREGILTLFGVMFLSDHLVPLVIRGGGILTLWGYSSFSILDNLVTGCGGGGECRGKYIFQGLDIF